MADKLTKFIVAGELVGGLSLDDCSFNGGEAIGPYIGLGHQAGDVLVGEGNNGLNVLHKAINSSIDLLVGLNQFLNLLVILEDRIAHSGEFLLHACLECLKSLETLVNVKLIQLIQLTQNAFNHARLAVDELEIVEQVLNVLGVLSHVLAEQAHGSGVSLAVNLLLKGLLQAGDEVVGDDGDAVAHNSHVILQTLDVKGILSYSSNYAVQALLHGRGNSGDEGLVSCGDSLLEIIE